MPDSDAFVEQALKWKAERDRLLVRNEELLNQLDAAHARGYREGVENEQARAALHPKEAHDA